MLLICISGKATERNLLLIPYPQQVSIKQGNYNLTDNVKIGADPLFTQELKKLQEVLTEDFGLKSQIVKPSKADISLCYDASFMQEEKEAYQLEVTDMKITIRAQMATGIFYGIQSLRQLIKSEAGKWIIPKLTITDYPALSWRSFMLDEGRYFKGEKVVKQILDEMALLKMNVFQWHLTDDQGWRIEIKKYPRLTEIGAFRDSTQMEWYESHHYDGKPHGGFYTQTQIRNIIKYASERHITIIPEIEMPGHSAAAIAAYPWLSATGKEIKVGANLGMYIAGTGTSKGINRGTITATTGTGVYIEDSGNSFDGTGGTIKSDKVGIYLKDTTAGTVTNTGTLEIASGGVGVFGENAQIDFEVDTSTSEGAIGVAASGTSVISGNIKTGQDSVGVYILDNDVTFAGADITTGNKNGGTSVGILFDSSKQGTYNVNNVTVNAKDGVGIYLQGTSGTTLNFGGTITTAGTGAVGIYVTTGTTLDSNNSSFNISNGAVGVYVTSGGTANLGTTGNLTFNFGTGGGTGVYNDGGTLTLGNNITVTGSGSLAATVNGDLTSSGNLTIGEGGTALLGKYDVGTIADKNITNTGNIKAESGGKGIAAIKGSSTPSGVITINNAGTITVSGKSSGGDSSIGIYTNIAEINSTGTVEVGTDGIGIYAADSGKAVKNDNMTMTGDNGIGVYIKGATGGLTANNITSTGGKGNTGLVLDGTTSSSLPLYINAGTITLGDESIGVMATGTASSTIDGSITVGDSSTGKSAIGIVAKNSNLNLTGITKITAGKGGIGIYAEGTSQVSNVDASKIIVGTDGIYMYSSVGTSISFTGNITADNQIGTVVGGSVSGAGSTITAKNGGIGAYVKGTGSSFTVTNIIVQSGIAETGTDPAKYSVGVYYEDAGAIASLPTVTQAGSYSIGTVLDRTTGTTTAGINIGTSGSNQVGVMAKGNSVFTIASGGIAVGNGDSNIGIYGENSTINVAGDISVGTASSLTDSSIGVSLKGGSYTGITGDLAVGNNSIGIYGTNMTGNISQSGTTMTVGDNGVGIYGSGTGNIILSMTTTGITLGNNNSIGVYAKGMNTDVTGDVAVGTNTSIGIVSEGNGNVTHNGDIIIADKGTGEGDTGSVGIYKLNGTGTITTTLGNNWTVGNNGYGIFVKQEAGQKATINNGANMTLGMSAVGIYSSGANTVNNNGTITVGETDTKGDPNKTQDHLNSVGIYVTNGTKVNNTGTINVEHDFSVGIYGSGIGTKITNVLGATISVDKGGVGILVQNGAVAENEGTITLGSTAGIYGATTVGMAAYSGASIINGSTGIINVGIGSGMIVGVGATLTNNGVINVTNGIGIEGAGHIINQGTIEVTGTGTDVGNTGVGSAEVGSIKIESNGDVIINDKYVGIGGTLTTAGAIEVNGAYVDVTTGVPLFNAQSVSGEVNILPNFALTGNGITYKIEGFVNTAMGTITGTKLTPVTSPLFIAKVTDKGDLVIAKRPYADLTIGEQFDALDKGLDNILANSGGIGKDAEILKGLNAYLEGLSADQFEGETSRKLAETRGDIYSTIQGRMQDINRAFDN
ncbi:family 20 glycosylhydrolase, partial [Fusobacterium ulcerans]|uniref:family 20 glycosylhydrolase n=1 Tax=Fusobacterium ulcerans TaxID=861 RepID=UPI0034E95F81